MPSSRQPRAAMSSAMNRLPSPEVPMSFAILTATPELTTMPIMMPQAAVGIAMFAA